MSMERSYFSPPCLTQARMAGVLAQFSVLLTLPSPLEGARGPSRHPQHRGDMLFWKPRRSPS